MNHFRGRLTAFLITVTLLGAAGAARGADEVEAVELDHPMLGEPAPVFRLSTVEGDTLGLNEYEGSFLVVHFGASW